MRAALALGLLAGALASPHAAAAPGVVIYRCVAPDGAVTLQNGRRCAKGLHEERRVLEVPTSRATPPIRLEAPVAPAPAAGPTVASDATEATTASDAPPTIEIGRASAPAIFACRTWDDQAYFGDSETPAPRCAPLQTVALDGRDTTAAEACELRVDRCEPVLETARCAAWAERLRRAEAALAFPTGDVDAARAERDRVVGAVAGTVCAP